ncbi:MAG: CpsD/CapB family tyrosine-protein kinase, partial [Woeseiales bacterium]
MSKIEQALRKARNDKSANDQDDHLEDHNQGAANQDKKRRPGRGRSLPALVQLEPCAHYDLEDDVLASNRILSEEYPDLALASYKMLRTRVLQKMRINQWQTLAITSPRDGAGKSLTAINLAIAMAAQGAQDVYLMDLDLRRPEIGAKLGIPGFELDLGECLAGRAPLDRVCCDVGIDRLFVLPSSQRQPNSSELISSPPLQGLLRRVRSMANDPIVIIDLPAILTADDAL